MPGQTQSDLRQSLNGSNNTGENSTTPNIKYSDDKPTIKKSVNLATSINENTTDSKDSIDRTKVKILVNPVTPLHKMNKDAIFALRREKIAQYKELKIYLDSYVPDNSIYGQIDERFDWLHDTQFFVANPYLLVLTSAGTKVNAILPYCGITHVEYSKNRIDVTYSKDSASKWFYYIYDFYPDSRGVVRLWFVNAYDAGLKFSHVDLGQSTNIEPVSNSADNVLNGIYSGRELFHVGKYNKNNISVDDPRAKLRIKNRNEKIIIYTKLWRSKPKSMDIKEDFSYVISIKP